MGIYLTIFMYLWDGYEIGHAKNDLVSTPRLLSHMLSTTNNIGVVSE